MLGVGHRDRDYPSCRSPRPDPRLRAGLHNWFPASATCLLRIKVDEQVPFMLYFYPIREDSSPTVLQIALCRKVVTPSHESFTQATQLVVLYSHKTRRKQQIKIFVQAHFGRSISQGDVPALTHYQDNEPWPRAIAHPLFANSQSKPQTRGRFGNQFERRENARFFSVQRPFTPCCHRT